MLYRETLPFEQLISGASSYHFFAKHLGYVVDIEPILAGMGCSLLDM